MDTRKLKGNITASEIKAARIIEDLGYIFAGYDFMDERWVGISADWPSIEPAPPHDKPGTAYSSESTQE